jgi:hypothetical protein
MSSSLRSALVVVGLLTLAATGLHGQAREWQVQGLAAFADSTFVGGGMGFALRSRGRARIGISANVGDRRGALAGRAELVVSYHLNPFRRRGLAPYAGGGVTVGATEDEFVEYVVVLVGVETAPGGRSGWFVEAGLAGGVRASAGFRVRWRPSRR